MFQIPSKRFHRYYGRKKEGRFIYIFTEGRETEPNYFESIKKQLRLHGVKINIWGTGHHTMDLIDSILGFVSRNHIETGDEVWAVFDRDAFKDFDSAINKARTNDISVAYSNEAFELWFLLHFSYMSSALSRKDYINKLNGYLLKLGERYEKKSKTMYSLLKPYEEDAIKNAKKLLTGCDSEKLCSKKNPSTTVHVLIEGLNKLKKEQL